MPDEQDIWYAVSMTRVLLAPRQTLETFGATTIRYHLISELMDSVDQVRVRSGKVFSERPQIITPNHFAQQLLAGFGEKAREYAEQLMNQGQLGDILQYGLQFRKEHISCETISEPLEQVAEKIRSQVEQENEPLAAVVIGADELWEVSLLKFIHGYIEQSFPHNRREILQSQAEETSAEVKREIELDFRRAAGNPHQIQALGQKLQDYGLFEEYEDRFYALLQ